MWFDKMMDQEVKRSPNLPNLYQQLEMVGCTIKNHLSPLLRAKA